mmetsp:Transcript_78678/g.131895  ORF Transcript_78678/g.131895 Transcript_78678/m.131895 type:complete len:201 (-) Transcript_78678:575-1177(-)
MVFTCTGLSTNGTPALLAAQNTGIAGNTSSLPQSHINDGRRMRGLILPSLSAVRRPSTTRLAIKYRFKKSGTILSISGPPGTSGHPASAAEMKASGNCVFAGVASNTASIRSSAVWRVMRSYVPLASGNDWEPDTMVLRLARPLWLSNSSPMACTMQSYPSFTRPWRVAASVASPIRHSTCSSAGSIFGGPPRRLRAVTL